MAQSKKPNEEQLEFVQAMSDFRRMFPSLEASVIENVLRNNAGAVDDTIDQLLVLTMTDHGSTSQICDQTIPKVLDDTPENPNQLYLKIPGNNSSLASLSPNALPPDAYNALQRDTSRPIRNIPAPDSISPDLLEDFASTGPNNSLYSRFGATNRNNSEIYGQKKVYKPPLLGKLPRDFLRLKVAVSKKKPPPNFGELDMVYEDLDSKRRRNKEAYARSEKVTNHGYPSSTTNLGVFRSHTLSGNEKKKSKHVYMDTEKESRRLKNLMIENEYRRQLATDPELAQFLADERVAIMLQDREFMRNIRKNKEFLAVLERDAPPVTRTKSPKSPNTSSGSTSSSKSLRRKFSGRKLMGDEVPLPDGPIVGAESVDRKEEKTTPVVFENYQEAYQGYGEEGGTDMLDSFPYTKTLPIENESDVVFQDRVKHMSKTSKQKFAILARKFLRKSKGAPGLLGTSTDHCSGMGLLESTDDYNYDTNEQHTDTAHAYNQHNDDMYNIGKRSDLKEGRLFSK